MANQTTVEVFKDGPAQVGEFGCNGAAPQGPVEVSAEVAALTGGESPTEAEHNLVVAQLTEIRAALIACGILEEAA